MNKLTSSVVPTSVNAATKNFDNALALTIILCQKCLLSRNSCENINNLQMSTTPTRIVQTGQLRCFLISTFSIDVKKYQNCPIPSLFSDLWAFESR